MSQIHTLEKLRGTVVNSSRIDQDHEPFFRVTSASQESCCTVREPPYTTANSLNSSLNSDAQLVQICYSLGEEMIEFALKWMAEMYLVRQQFLLRAIVCNRKFDPEGCMLLPAYLSQHVSVSWSTNNTIHGPFASIELKAGSNERKYKRINRDEAIQLPALMVLSTAVQSLTTCRSKTEVSCITTLSAMNSAGPRDGAPDAGWVKIPVIATVLILIAVAVGILVLHTLGIIRIPLIIRFGGDHHHQTAEDLTSGVPLNGVSNGHAEST